MGSKEAMEKGSGDRYGQDEYEPNKRTAEGVSAHVPYKGPLSEELIKLMGGLQSGMGYLGARRIQHLCYCFSMLNNYDLLLYKNL